MSGSPTLPGLAGGIAATVSSSTLSNTTELANAALVVDGIRGTEGSDAPVVEELGLEVEGLVSGDLGVASDPDPSSSVPEVPTLIEGRPVFRIVLEVTALFCTAVLKVRVEPGLKTEGSGPGGRDIVGAPSPSLSVLEGSTDMVVALIFRVVVRVASLFCKAVLEV